jgi:hypothetical protein
MPPDATLTAMSVEEGNSVGSAANSLRASHTVDLRNLSEEERIYRYAFDVIQRQQDPLVLEYEFLHRLNLVAIGKNLVRCKEEICQDDKPSQENLDRLRQLLNQYGGSTLKVRSPWFWLQSPIGTF